MFVTYALKLKNIEICVVKKEGYFCPCKQTLKDSMPYIRGLVGLDIVYVYNHKIQDGHNTLPQFGKDKQGIHANR